MIPGNRLLRHRGFILLLSLIMMTSMTWFCFAVAEPSPPPAERARAEICCTESSKTWYLADIATTGGLQTWIHLMNPDEKGANAELTFYSGGGTVESVSYIIGAGADVSINAAEFVKGSEPCAIVESDRSIVAESSIYDTVRESTSFSLGSTRTSNTWHLPGGSAAGSAFETLVYLHNPACASTEARVHFHTAGGVVGPLCYGIGAGARLSINMGDHVSGFGVTTFVDSDEPIVAASTTRGEPVPDDPKQKVVAVAHAQLGKPYSTGAAGPGAFDCSGMVQYCYRIGAGVSLPHSSYSQANCGARVPADELKPGDIVGFHGWGHTGIYIGEGQYIHAPQTGEFVRIDPLPAREDYCGAVRP